MAVVAAAALIEDHLLDAGMWKTLESSGWGRYQVSGAARPSEEWVKFFIQTLLEHIDDEGNFGVPMYAFVNDTSDFTAVPTMPGPDFLEGMFTEA